MDDSTVRFVLAIVVIAAGFAFLAGLVYFGFVLHSDSQRSRLISWAEYYVNTQPHPGYQSPGASNLLEIIASSEESYLDKRNDFWQAFGQVALAVLVVVVLGVLLILKVISAEAGLPILSGVSGFAIAKSSSGRSPGRPGNSGNQREGS